MVKDTHIDGSLIKEQMMLLGLNPLIKIETTTLLKADTHVFEITVVATSWDGGGILCRLFEPSFMQSMICTLSHSHIYSSITGCFFFYENHSPPPIEENQVKGQISQGTSSALLLALVLLLSAVSVLLLTSWRPPCTLTCPAQCCSSLRIRAW